MNRTADEPAPALETETSKPRRRPTRRSPLLKWMVVLVVLGGGIWAGIRYWTRPAGANLEYKTSAVTRGDITQSVTANGSLTPVQLVEVGSQISGTITEIKVDYNSRVKAGEIVAQIDPATYERALGQARGPGGRARDAQGSALAHRPLGRRS